MVFKLADAAQKSWRRLDGHNQLPKLIQGVRFTDGIEVATNPASSQSQTAAARTLKPSPAFGDSSLRTGNGSNAIGPRPLLIALR